MQGACTAGLKTFKADDGTTFHRPTSLREVFTIMEASSQYHVRVVAGNTGSGVYKNWPVEPVLIELKHIPQLRKQNVSQVGPVSMAVGF